MNNSESKILVTGAGGQLGQLVLAELIKRVDPGRVVAMVRNADSAAKLASFGADTRIADYDDVVTLDAALVGIGRILLISSTALGRRVAQHCNVIDAAKRASIELIAYTSVLRADDSPLSVAPEHRATEAAIRESGLQYAMLRNGWYTENFTGALAPAIAHGVLLGGAGEGLISAASRADYAAAAAVVLADPQPRQARVLELAGDGAFRLADLAAELARKSGTPVAYHNLPEADYKATLLKIGLPEPLASLISQSDAAAVDGALFDNGCQLSALIGRPTTPMPETVSTALATI